MHIRTTLLASFILAAASTAQASPYVGAGWQYNDVSVDRGLRRPVIGGQTLDLGQADREDSIRFFAGWEFSPAWGIEIAGYRVNAGVDTAQRISATEVDEREASVDGTHVALMPYWRWPFADALSLRIAAGLLYGDYSIEQSREIDVDNAPDVPLARSSRDEREWGATAGLGVAWRVREQIELGVAYEHGRTGTVSSSGLNATIAWRF